MTAWVVRVLRGRFTGLTVILVVLSISSAALGEGKLHNLIAAMALMVLLLLALRNASRGFCIVALILAVPASLGQLTLHVSRSPIPPSLVLSPGSFAVSSGLATASNWGIPKHPLTPLFQYYSFITLTTLGYGDMSPLTRWRAWRRCSRR